MRAGADRAALGRLSRPAVAGRCHPNDQTGTACIGTPDDAIAYIEKLIEDSGGFGVMMELGHNRADWTRRANTMS